MSVKDINDMDRRIDTLGATNKKRLRDAFGIRNIREAYSIYGVTTANDAYEVMRNEYNRIIDAERVAMEAQKQANKARLRAEKLAKRAEERRRAKEQAEREMAEERKFNTARILDIEFTVDEYYADGFDSDDQIIRPIMEVCQQLAGKEVDVLSSMDGNVFRHLHLSIGNINNARTIYFDYIRQALYRGSDEFLFQIMEQKARIVIFVSNEALPNRLIQRYLDGATHCVIQPLVELYERYLDNAESKSSITTFKNILKRLKELEQIYSDGVPEDKMHDIGHIIKRCIVIHDVIGNEISRYNEKSNKYFRFTNTRKNHLEQNVVPIDNYQFVSKDEMRNIIGELEDNKIFYMIRGDINGTPNRLHSTKGAYAVRNDDYEVFAEFDKSINKHSYKLDAMQYPEVNDLVLEARIINACPTPLCEEPNELEGVKHLDLTKAYTQHKKCEHYAGFLGHITNYSKLEHVRDALQFMEKHIGIYQVKIVKNPSRLLLNLGIFENYVYTLPSAEIIGFIKSYGLKVKLIAGAWGTSFDFDYTPEMLENRRYAIWAGKNGTQHNHDIYKFKGDLEWAQHLAHSMGRGRVFYNDEHEIITIKHDVKYLHTYHHILAFITAYTRLNVLSILDKIPEENRVKVILDGIYYRGEIEDVVIPHKNNKELKTHIGFRQFWYYPTMLDTANFPNYDARFTENAILAGAGGSGKTHAVFNCKSLIKPLYVVPTHILGKQLCEKYGCRYATINRLIGDGCESYKMKYGDPHTILIDELTMIKEPDIMKALEMYPKSLILIAGDIDEKQWYQCRNGEVGAFSPLYRPKNVKYVHFTNDYRSKDEELKKFKLAIRNEMKRIFTDSPFVSEDTLGGRMGADIINEWLKTNSPVPIIPAEEAVKQFVSFDDVFIAGTHETNKKLLEHNCVSGHINAQREINYNGEGEKRGSFTIHSYQGLTIADKRVFIMMDTFEYAMIYTAVSRCTHINQIVLVKPFKPVRRVNISVQVIQ